MEGDGKEEKMKDLREAFGVHDGDESGVYYIQKRDEQNAHGIGESKSVDGRMVMIKQFDLNGDGVTSFEEFRVIQQSMAMVVSFSFFIS
ncbi:hypothetical protein Gotri_018063 [Gossypium trilobum]|uniref:EF-hand domain-containing protein n=1 Tax=Gossypium trilobum TaxID=34281 RepID=A0A7J9E8H5_9ROSI|nr:hypothetical protein [Gossypium trilobum]